MWNKTTLLKSFAVFMVIFALSNYNRNASLKGKILSVESKQPVEGALLIFNSKSVDKKYTSGRLVSDMNGEYSISGLTAPGLCELSIFHWRHNDFETGYTIRLEVGENTRDFILQPRKESKKKLEKMKKRFDRLKHELRLMEK